MYVTSVHVQGFRNAEDFEATDLGRIVDLPAGPPGIAVADALLAFAGSLHPDRIGPVLTQLGLVEGPPVVLVEDGLPIQVTLAEGFGVPSLLPPDGSRNLRVTVEVKLDPPLFGKLRQLAVRDPRLVTALGEGARIKIKVGWLFTTDHTVLSIALLGVSVGDTAFPIIGSERPVWLVELLHDIGSRFGRVKPASAATVVSRLLDAALSQDPERRSRYSRLAEALASPPFSLGRLEIVRSGNRLEPCFGTGLLRARQFGSAADEALVLTEAVLLDSPDVLIIEAPGIANRDPAAVRGWLSAHADGDRATLEQVVFAAGGTADVEGAA